MTESQWPPWEDDLSSHILQIFCRTCFIFIRLFLTVSVPSGDTTSNPALVTVLLFPISQTEAHCPALNKNLLFFLSFFSVSLIFLSCTLRSQGFFFTLWQATMETRLPTAKVIVSMMHVWGCVRFDSRQCFVFPRVKLLEHVETLRRRNLLGMSVMATAWTGPPGNACWNINIQLSTITQIQTNTINTHKKKAFSAAYF